jgi:hypothetical protein
MYYKTLKVYIYLPNKNTNFKFNIKFLIQNKILFQIKYVSYGN